MILLCPAYMDRAFFYTLPISPSYIHDDLMPP
nr:MAG TPA: hypothetical protein [Caudoviricetes sp.]